MCRQRAVLRCCCAWMDGRTKMGKKNQEREKLSVGGEGKEFLCVYLKRVWRGEGMLGGEFWIWI